MEHSNPKTIELYVTDPTTGKVSLKTKMENGHLISNR